MSNLIVGLDGFGSIAAVKRAACDRREEMRASHEWRTVVRWEGSTAGLEGDFVIAGSLAIGSTALSRALRTCPERKKGYTPKYATLFLHN
jgi:hypothetical protein